MANPYEKYNTSEENPYTKYGTTDSTENPYTKYGTNADFSYNPSNLFDLAASKLAGVAGAKGDEEEIKKRIEERNARAKDASILKGVGTAALDIVGGIPAGIVAPIAGIASGISQGSAEKGLETAKDVFHNMAPSTWMGADTSNPYYESTMLATGVTPITEGIQALGQGAGSAAGLIGASPETQKEISSGTELGLMAGGGALLGKGVYKGVKNRINTPKNIEPTPEDIPIQRGSTEHLQAAIIQSDKDIARTEYKINKIEKDIADIGNTFDSPEKAQQYKQARIEEIQQHEQALVDLKKGKAVAEEKLNGKPTEEPTIPGEVSDASAQEYIDLINERKQLAPKVTDFETPSPELDRLDEINSRLKDLASEGVGARDGSTIDIAPFTEALEARGLPDPLGGEHPSQEGEGGPTQQAWDELPKFQEEVGAQGEAGTPISVQETPVEHIEITAPERPKGLVINGGSAFIRSVITDWVHKLGLHKEDLDFNIGTEESANFEGGIGHALINEKGKPEINIRAAESLKRLIESNPEFGTKFRSLASAQAAQFREAWTAAHELGHILLAKLLQNDLFFRSSKKPGQLLTGENTLGVSQLLADYDNFMSARTHDEITKAGNLFSTPKSRPDYYMQFPEFFSQRVARELMFGKSTSKGPIATFVRTIKGFIKDAMKNLGLEESFSKNVVDSFIQDLIKENKNSLDKFGKTIFEMNSTSTSLKQAWQWQNENLYYDPPKGDIVNAEDINNAVKHIENAEAVISAMSTEKDISPFASKVVAWRFGIQPKAEMYRGNSGIKYATNVILNTMHKKTQRRMELLAGVTSRAAYKAKNKFLISLKKIQNDDSPAVVFNKTSNEDFYAVHQVLERAIGSHSYEEALKEFGSSLSATQKRLFNVASDLFTRMHEMGASVGEELGKKNILPSMKGWFPAVRKGEFTVNFRIEGLNRIAGYDPTGRALMTDLVRSQSFRTRGEAEAFIKHFESMPNEFKGHLQHRGIEKIAEPENIDQIADFHRIYQEQSSKLSVDLASIAADTAPKWLKEEAAQYGNNFQSMLDARMQKVVDLFVTRGGVLGGHHRLRTNVEGAMGSEMFSTAHDAGKAFRDAIYKSVDEFTSQMQKLEINEKLDLILNKPELWDSHRNTMEFIQLTKDYALNNVKSALDFTGAKATVDAVWEQMWQKTPLHKLEMFGARKYNEMPVTDIALRKMSSLFYIHALMSRGVFWVGQSVQFLWAGRSMFKDGTSFIDANVHAGKGFWQVVKPDKDFMEALFHTSQTSHTFEPQFVKAINSHALGEFLQEGSKTRLLFEIITGEKQSTMADTFSRLMTYGMMYEHYKATGLRGEELANAAAKSTDANMVQYGKDYQAPMFRKMGVVGEMVAPLHTFTTAAMGNMIADIGDILRAPGAKAKLQASLPFLSTMAITGLMTGVLGTPFIAEYESLRLLINYIASKFGHDTPPLPSAADWAISGDNTFSNRIISHGILSASTLPATEGEGLNIGSTNKWQAVIDGINEGQTTFMSFLPVLNWYFQRAGDVNVLVQNVAGLPAPEGQPEGKVRTATMNLVPGGYKGVVDDLLYNAQNREMVPDSKGDALVPQTNTERAAKYLGTSTLNSDTKKLQMRRAKLEDMRRIEKINNKFSVLTDAILNGNQNKTAMIAKDLAMNYQVEPQQLLNRINLSIYKKKVPATMRRFVGVNGKMSMTQMEALMRWQQTYETNPLEEGVQ